LKRAILFGQETLISRRNPAEGEKEGARARRTAGRRRNGAPWEGKEIDATKGRAIRSGTRSRIKKRGGIYKDQRGKKKSSDINFVEGGEERQTRKGGAVFALKGELSLRISTNKGKEKGPSRDILEGGKVSVRKKGGPQEGVSRSLHYRDLHEKSLGEKGGEVISI